jgi:hypothetical protein
MPDGGMRASCDPHKCTNTCPVLPFLEAVCCKSDQTCGCGVLGVLACN